MTQDPKIYEMFDEASIVYDIQKKSVGAEPNRKKRAERDRKILFAAVATPLDARKIKGSERRRLWIALSRLFGQRGGNTKQLNLF